MVVMKENFWNFRGNDSLDRSHIPPTPIWIAIIRVVQLLFALLTLILVAVGASYFGSSWASVGITAFTFALTLIHIGWLAISILAFPIAYNYWAQLGVEIASVIFWLASWASLAADGSALGTIPTYRGVYPGSTDTGRYNTAAGCIKGAAGVGALTWLLFVATLVFFVISLVQYRKAKAPAAGTTGPEAGEPKPGHELSQVPQQPQAYVQPDQYGQQVPPQQQFQPQQQYQQQPYQGGQPATYPQ
ncbi:hypothetical protein MAPG_04612 [Magnaporthiopsis poae ATCC 64411]|uniref:MARVEL domain-containing protein n=1 Tax=Magnaporthiopsis poae (strain ATCC 64411 / 73-15) TaxID=644358 RepID=A0A0C4DX74_MAGP6|nr:hypothetical protein MAPG_04612 [Magnaporthiopsis poae ATCC 64411]